MSNVSIGEIFELTSAAFNVSFADMAKAWPGNRRGRRCAAIEARACAVMLCRRHTTVTMGHVARHLKRNSGTAPSRILAQAVWFENSDYELDLFKRSAVLAIEDKIDELHEMRVAVIPAVIRRAPPKGFEGLACVEAVRPVKQARAPRNKRKLIHESQKAVA